MAKAILFGSKGQFEVELNEKVYEAAHDAKCSLPQYLQRTYGADVDPKVHGSVFNQLLAQCNMNLTKDRHTGLGSATMRDIFDGAPSMAITRDAVPLSRILAPAAILELVEMHRAADTSSDVAAFASMLAVDTTIAGARYEQPVFDASNADMQTVSRVGQLQVPNIVGSLTVSQRAGSIPTYGYGLEISDQAIKALTIDQTSIYLQRMATSQAAARVDMHINALVGGNEDVGQAALTKVKANTFDSAASGKLTHKAYIKWLRQNRRLRTISHVMCDEDTYYKVIQREGRPTHSTIYVEDKEILAYPSRPMNFGLEEPQIFIVNTGVIPTDTLVGIDSRFAIQRIRNSEADYKATEQLIMRRGTQMRFDEAEVVFRLDDTAWSVLDLTP